MKRIGTEQPGRHPTTRRAGLAGLAAVLAGLAGPAAAGERPGRPAPPRPLLCPEDAPEDAPEGVRLPERPGCGAGAARARAGTGDGFRDLGDGVRLRVGGRVAAEYGLRR